LLFFGDPITEIVRGLVAMVLGEPPGDAFVHLRPDRFEDGTLAYESAIV
jgi:hypothetical protein